MALKKIRNLLLFMARLEFQYTSRVFVNRLITNTTINWNSIDLSTNGQTKTFLTSDLNWLESSAMLNSILKDKMIAHIFETYILGSVFSQRCKTTIILRFEILFLTGNCLLDILIIIILITTFTVVLSHLVNLT